MTYLNVKLMSSRCVAYVLTDVVTGTFYVGSTGNFNARLSSHKSKLNKGIHDNHIFQRSFSGWHNIQIEYIDFPTLDAARQHEQSLLDYHAGDPLLSNIGTGSTSLWGNGMPEEYRQNLIESSRRYARQPQNVERVRKMNFERPREQVLANMAKARAAQGPASEETRRRMSESWHLRGGISPETRRKMNEANARREVHFSPTARARQLEVCRKAIVIEGVFYPSIAAAAKVLGLGESTIRYRLKSENRPDWNYL